MKLFKVRTINNSTPSFVVAMNQLVAIKKFAIKHNSLVLEDSYNSKGGVNTYLLKHLDTIVKHDTQKYCVSISECEEAII
jgi:hypothetical protein